MDAQLAELKALLKLAVRHHYAKLVASVSDIYGYSLYTSDGVHSIGPVANRVSAICVHPSDSLYNYYRFGAVEWSEWDDFGFFDGVNAIVSSLHDDESIDFVVKRDGMLNALLGVLSELEAEGLFGPRTFDRFVVICVADSDMPIMLESARLLNSPDAFAAYCSEFG
jgi:hypothetical protein